MLYSEFKERQKRFTAALKIGFPFLVIVIFHIGIFPIFDIKYDDTLLLILFIFVYIYYIFYMIYSGFQRTLIDDNTNAFNMNTTAKVVQKFLNQRKKSGYIVMMKIENISYIEEQYGGKIKNEVLKKIINKLNSYLLLYGFKNIPMGHYYLGSFLIIFESNISQKQLKHILNGFCKEIKNDGIFKIEVKINTAVLDKFYDQDIKNITLKLTDMISNTDIGFDNVLKPTEFDILVKNAINARKFEFSYHALRSFKNMDAEPEIFSVSSKLSINHYGSIPASQAMISATKNGYEIKADQIRMQMFFDEIKLILNRHRHLKFIIRISAVSFRNRSFFIFLKEAMKEKMIEPSSVCFSIFEKKIYDDFDKFQTIVKEYKSCGFCVAIDQFGNKNIGAEYLKHGIEFDMANFDLEYVKNITNRNYSNILKMLVEVARSFNVGSIIKFVDKVEALKVLEDIKPDYVQGFLFDKPKILKNFEEKI